MNTYRLPLAWLVLFPTWLLAQPAPDFTITATDNQTHQLYADYLNNGKTVVLDIMFTSCPPCNAMAPMLEPLYQDWGAGQQDVVFFSLSDKAFDDNADVADFEATHGLSFHGAGQDGGSLNAVAPYKAGTYGPFNGTPTFVVIAPDGSVTYNPRGSNQAATVDSIDAAIEATGAMRPVILYSVGGQLTDENDQALGNVTVHISSQNDPTLSDGNGNYQFPTELAGTTVSIRPEKDDDDRNGVNLLDLVLLQRHMLFIDVFDSPYQYFAADINRSQSILPSDLVLLQRFLLFLDVELTHNTSWRYLPRDFTFLNPDNPLAINPPDSIVLSNLDANQSNADFIGVKVGDINGNADPSGLVAPQTGSSATTQSWWLEDGPLERGARRRLVIRGSYRDMYAVGGQIRFDPDALQIVDIEPLEAELAEAWRDNRELLAEGRYPFNWLPFDRAERMAPREEALLALEVIAKRDLERLPLSLAGEIWYAEETGDLRFSNLELSLVNDPSTATRDLLRAEVEVYPNPAGDQVWVRGSNTVLPGGSWYLRNGLGQIVRAFEVPLRGQSSQQLDLTGIAPGLYTLYSVSDRGTHLVAKVYKQ
ncbi:MAG: redoxin family protein [Bacteroidota bacterium]